MTSFVSLWTIKGGKEERLLHTALESEPQRGHLIVIDGDVYAVDMVVHQLRNRQGGSAPQYSASLDVYIKKLPAMPKNGLEIKSLLG